MLSFEYTILGRTAGVGDTVSTVSVTQGADNVVEKVEAAGLLEQADTIGHPF